VCCPATVAVYQTACARGFPAAVAGSQTGNGNGNSNNNNKGNLWRVKTQAPPTTEPQKRQ
jgi:hypothetical protein